MEDKKEKKKKKNIANKVENKNEESVKILEEKPVEIV